MEKLKIKSFLIEYRVRIQAGNCFIAFSKSLENHQTKVSLKSDEIIIQVDDDTYKVETKKFFDINVKSFHSLIVKESFISFRFITANGNTFDAEVLKVNGNCNKFQRIGLSIDEDDENVTVNCSNCDSLLTIEKSLAIKRIRELPSSNLNISDWFCHRHDNEKLFDDTNEGSQCFNEQTQQFQPKISDIFYGPFCLLMNSQNFEKSRLRQKRKLIYCKRCLQLMGESSQTITKFWWESIKVSGRPFFDVASPINLIKNVIKNHLSCDGLGFLTPIVKIIFESSLPADDQKVHILIQVMDKNLQLMRLDLDDLQLVERRSIKVMYIKLKAGNDDDERTLKYWQKDINIVSYELSIKMFHILSEYLKTQSELIPETYRSNNGFQLSYIEFV